MTTSLCPVTHDYGIGAETRSWHISKRRRRNGVDTWEPVAWYQCPVTTRNELRDRLVRESGAKTPQDLVFAYENAEEALAATFDVFLSVADPDWRDRRKRGEPRSGRFLPAAMSEPSESEPV